MGSNTSIKIDPLIRGLLPRYFQNRQDDAKTLQESLASHDYATIELISHRVKGNAASYGFPALGQICAKMEQACVQKKIEQIGPLVNEYSEFIKNIKL